MTKTLSLKLIVIIAIAGLLFSGYLSYNELFADGCSKALISCGSKKIVIAELPACVYGFFMYALLLLLSLLGLKSKN